MKESFDYIIFLEQLTKQKISKDQYSKMITVIKEKFKGVDKNQKLNLKGLYILKRYFYYNKFYKNHVISDKNHNLHTFYNQGYIAIENILPVDRLDTIIKCNKDVFTIKDPNIISIMNTITKLNCKLFKCTKQNSILNNQTKTQNQLHTDRPWPTIKAWIYLEDIDEKKGAFQYVPESHHMNEYLLKYYYDISICNPKSDKFKTHTENINSNLSSKERNILYALRYIIIVKKMKIEFYKN